MRERPAQKTKPDGTLGKKLQPKVIPDDAIPFGDGKSLYSPSMKALFNVDACIEAYLAPEES